jgi:hypothetical protein
MWILKFGKILNLNVSVNSKNSVSEGGEVKKMFYNFVSFFVEF